MPQFGEASKKKLERVDPRLIEVLNRVIPYKDFTIISGFRGKAEQDLLFAEGRSTKKWPDSKHNRDAEGNIRPPCPAVDIAPWFSSTPNVRWDDQNEFILLAGMIIQAGREIGVTIRWGGNWDMDDDAMDDQSFQDLGHFEIVE